MTTSVALLVVGLVVGGVVGGTAGVVLGSLLERRAWWAWVARNPRDDIR